MAVYGGDDTALTAIAQHYGIPTTFLDLTTNPEIAVLFAKSSTGAERSDEAVIYCFLEAGLKSVAVARLIRINIDNLWRLEAQRGLFLDFLEESLIDTLRARAIRIHFPSEFLAAEERTRLYPVRKSALESIIDQWVFRASTPKSAAQKKFTGPLILLSVPPHPIRLPPRERNLGDRK
jgi:hypothetical protein